MSVQGRRVDGRIPQEPGDYGLVDGKWWAKVPQPGFSSAVLSDHTVVENSDRTITVQPSILMEHGERVWHGYLVSGRWNEI